MSSGSLATKSLAPIVDPSLLVQDSEYLESHLIVVPSSSNKEFLKSYETLSPMVVPRSCVQVAQDDEFTLFAVTTFKKHSADFLHKCRENKWTPRHYKYVEGGKEEEQKELDRLTREEKKVWGEALHMGRTGWSECVMIWIHVLTLRVFVETVLRYGLPLEYLCVLIQVCAPVQKTRPIPPSRLRPLLTVDPDKLQASKEDQGEPGLNLLLPRRGCIRQRQEGTRHQGRCCLPFGHGRCRSWQRRGIGVHGIRVL